MTEEQVNKLKQMLSSQNLDDINLAGNMIKEQLLKISDEDLKTFWQLVDTLQANSNKPNQPFTRTIRDLLRADVHKDEHELVGSWISTTNVQPYYTTGVDPYDGLTTTSGDTIMASTGTLILNNE